MKNNKETTKNKEHHKKIERSLITTYKKTILNKFVAAIKDFKLIKENDKIAVCISGGKDSMILAKLMEHLQKYSDFNFSIKFIVMDPGYNQINKEQIKENGKKLNIDLNIFFSNIFKVVDKTEKTPCYLCARMRRGYLYRYAKELGCNKIALGHHFDDVIETNLLSILYGAQVRTMMPKIKSSNFENMELIRPLYYVEEKHIINWQNYNDLKFIKCGCPLINKNDGAGKTKRDLVKKIIEELYIDNNQIKKNIFKSMDKINLETVLGYVEDDKQYSFLDKY